MSISEFIVAIFLCNAVLGISPSNAMEQISFDSLHPEDDDRLEFLQIESIPSGGEIGKFQFGSWPFPKSSVAPFPLTRTDVVRGNIKDTSWANPYLLRVLPGAFSWATTSSLSGLNEKLNMGRDPITISFSEPICAFGALYAQSGAHNPHHPNLRRRTTFHFFDSDGVNIASFDLRPGHFLTKAAFQRDLNDSLVWAVAMESEVHFALKEIIAMPCVEFVG